MTHSSDHRMGGGFQDCRRQALKGHPHNQQFIAVVVLLLVLFPIGLSAQQKRKEENPWPTHMNQVLGIQPDSEPHYGTIGYSFSATVIDAQRLAASGISGIRNGDRLKITHLGDGQWRMKHYVTGFAIVIDLKVRSAE